MAAVRRNISVRGYVDGTGRRDQLDYPLEAVREAVVNALLHRDYSPVSRGTQVTVNLYPDGLTVTSPGALFGPVTVAELGEEGISSSRNGYLAQILALAYLAHGQELTNAALREFGADRAEATRVLGDLVAAGLATRTGGRRYARYELADPVEPANDGLFPDLFSDPDEVSTYDAVAALLRRAGRITAAALARQTGRSRPAVLAAVRKLINEGSVQPHGASTSPRRTYVWTGPGRRTLTEDDREPG